MIVLSTCIPVSPIPTKNYLMSSNTNYYFFKSGHPRQQVRKTRPKPRKEIFSNVLTHHTSAIEIMGSSQTRPDIIPLLMKETHDHGFQPFHVRKSSTGYTFNRYLANHVIWNTGIHANHV